MGMKKMESECPNDASAVDLLLSKVLYSDLFGESHAKLETLELLFLPVMDQSELEAYNTLITYGLHRNYHFYIMKCFTFGTFIVAWSPTMNPGL